MPVELDKVQPPASTLAPRVIHAVLCAFPGVEDGLRVLGLKALEALFISLSIAAGRIELLLQLGFRLLQRAVVDGELIEEAALLGQIPQICPSWPIGRDLVRLDHQLRRHGGAVIDDRALELVSPPQQVVDRLQALLPTLPDEVPTRGTTRLRVVAKVELDDAGADPWRVELTMTTPDGTSTRRFSASACEDAAAAAVLVIAIALDPVQVAEGLHESFEPAPTPSEPTPSEPTPSEPTPSEPAASEAALLLDAARRSAPRVGLRVFGTGAWGPTRTGYGGIGGSVALFGPRWRWELSAGWSIPRVVGLDDARRASVDGWWVGTRGCFVPELGALEFPLCPGVELGQVRGRGIAPTANPRSATFAWVAPLIGQGLVWSPLDRLAIGVEFALLVPLTRGSFSIAEREVQRLALVGARALLGVELRLP